MIKFDFLSICFFANEQSRIMVGFDKISSSAVTKRVFYQVLENYKCSYFIFVPYVVNCPILVEMGRIGFAI